MKAFLRSAVTVLTMLIAAAWISGCVIHAHHVDSDDKAKPAKKHKAKPAKKHKAKPPTEAEPTPAETEDEGDEPTRHNPPTPPPPSNTL